MYYLAAGTAEDLTDDSANCTIVLRRRIAELDTTGDGIEEFRWKLRLHRQRMRHMHDNLRHRN